MSATDKPDPQRNDKDAAGDTVPEGPATTPANSDTGTEFDTAAMGDGPLADDGRTDAPVPQDPVLDPALEDNLQPDAPLAVDAVQDIAPDAASAAEQTLTDASLDDAQPSGEPFAETLPTGIVPPGTGAPELGPGGDALADAQDEELRQLLASKAPRETGDIDSRNEERGAQDRGAAAQDRPSPPPAPPPSAPSGAAQRGGALAMVLGGVVAAAIGAGATYVLLPYWGGAAPHGNEADIAQLRASVEELGAQLDETGTAIGGMLGRIETLEGADGGAPAGELDALRAEIETLRSDLAEGIGDGAETRAQIEAAAAEAAAQIAAAEEQAAALRADAEEQAESVRGRAAVGQLRAALDGGLPLEPALAALSSAGVAQPDALGGEIPTLAELQDAFVPAARASLAASRRVAAADEGTLGRIGAFLMAETGARSLTPRQGTDPDAVLSRAEAALDRADVPAALAEIATLPSEGQAPFAEWTTAAERRQAAIAATDALLEQLN